MPGFLNHVLRVHHNELATRVQLLHGSRCPCCRYPMVSPRRKNAASVKRRDRMTVAHDRAVGFGGSDEVWVYACQGCNSDQGVRSFRQWSHVLERLADRRAVFVAELADVVDAYLKEKNRARYSSVSVFVSAEA